MFNALVCPRLLLLKMAGVTNPIPEVLANLANGWSSNLMVVPDAKIKSIANASIIGTGGPPINDVTDNFLKDHANEANCSTWTRIVEVPDVIANQNGTFIIGHKVKNVSSKSLLDLVLPDNILPTILLLVLRNVIASKTTFLIPAKVLVLNSLLEDLVRMDNWWLKIRKEDFNAIVVLI